MTIKYVVPDTNCWIERRGDLIRIMETDRYQLEVILALHVRHELEGLTNNERVRNEAKTALDMIRKNNIRCLTSKGALLQGGKNYGEVKEERTRNDDIIKNSVKCLAGAVLLTDDRNLIVKSRSEKVPVDSMKSFRQWLEKA